MCFKIGWSLKLCDSIEIEQIMYNAHKFISKMYSETVLKKKNKARKK